MVFAKSDGDTTLPDGQATTINGQPGILNKGLSGQYRQNITDTTGAVDQNGLLVNIKSVTIDYTGASELTWVVGNTRYEMLSNLSVEEMLKIATKLVPAK